MTLYRRRSTGKVWGKALATLVARPAGGVVSVKCTGVALSQNPCTNSLSRVRSSLVLWGNSVEHDLKTCQTIGHVVRRVSCVQLRSRGKKVRHKNKVRVGDGGTMGAKWVASSDHIGPRISKRGTKSRRHKRSSRRSRSTSGTPALAGERRGAAQARDEDGADMASTAAQEEEEEQRSSAEEQHAQDKADKQQLRQEQQHYEQLQTACVQKPSSRNTRQTSRNNGMEEQHRALIKCNPPRVESRGGNLSPRQLQESSTVELCRRTMQQSSTAGTA